MRKYLLTLSTILLIAAVSGYFFYSRKPEISYKTVKMERGTIVANVAATGNLSAVTTVQVGTQVSGTIQKLYVDYNSRVKKGQAIAEIDPSLFNASVEQSQGNFLTAEANLLKGRVTAYDSARATLKAAEGTVAQTRGALLQAKTNLRYSIIRSPVDGVIISRAVDVGQTVAASFQTPTLFTIAQDLTKMQIEVSVDEADISRIRLDQKATFTVDAYPEQSFKGKVVQIRNAPIISQNVVTYIVVVTVDNSELKLKPGMTANVSVEVARKDEVLKLSPAALRFRPKAKADEPKEKKSAAVSAGGGAREGGGKPGGRKGAGGQQVYVLKDGNPSAVAVKTGIANNSSIELVEGALKEGDEVIIEQIGGDNGKKKPATGSPMGRPF